MSTSVAMQEIRKIRDENSLRHLNMTLEERKKEAEEAIDWLATALGKPIRVVSGSGNYTVEREAALNGTWMDDIVPRIKSRENK